MPLVSLHGQRELNALFAKAGKEAKAAIRRGEADIAQPLKHDIEQHALTDIRRIGPKWWRMRVGVTTNLVYVAPVQRGVKGRGDLPRRRPKFADLMEQRAFAPAVARNQPLIEGRVEALLEQIAADWNAL